MGTNRADRADGAADVMSTETEIAELLKKGGGRQEDRTPDLCLAKAALSQLS
jgi:hypothetical protein